MLCCWGGRKRAGERARSVLVTASVDPHDLLRRHRRTTLLGQPVRGWVGSGLSEFPASPVRNKASRNRKTARKTKKKKPNHERKALAFGRAKTLEKRRSPVHHERAVLGHPRRQRERRKEVVAFL